MPKTFDKIVSNEEYIIAKSVVNRSCNEQCNEGKQEEYQRISSANALTGDVLRILLFLHADLSAFPQY